MSSSFDMFSGQLEKLIIEYEDRSRGVFSGKLTALFNPSEVKIDRQVGWSSTPPLTQQVAADYQHVEFRSSPPATISMELFFDTSEGDPQPASGFLSVARLGKLLPDLPWAFAEPTGVSVRKYTDQLEKLALVNRELHRPPLCRLRWGTQLYFTGYLTNLSARFHLFMKDGMPVRATMSTTFTQVRSRDGAHWSGELHSNDVHKFHIVMQGDSLQSIALKQYGDLQKWRLIATANRIDNPRKLTPGLRLLLPAQNGSE